MEPKQLGPVGGDGGNPFDAYDIPDDARLSAIHVYSEWVIDALRFDYVQANGATGGRPPVGGLGGHHHVFYLDDDEFLIGLSGRCGWYIDGLRFHTNKRVSDLYGGQGGERDFALMAPPEYEISGLFGRSDWYIDALGVRVRPVALRQELWEGEALLAEAEAEETAAAVEASLDDMIDAVAAEIAAEADARRYLGVERGSEALIDLLPDAEAMGGEMLSPQEAAELEAVALEELVAALEEEIEAEQLGSALEESLELAAIALDEDEWDEAEGWEEWPDDGEPIDAAVVLRRATVASEEAVEALEESATAEAIAALSGGQPGEGTVDVVVYTQVDEATPGNSVATVMAVARAATGAAEAGDAPAETAVMVTDAIDSEDELLELEREAVEGAIESLEEDLGQLLSDADVSIYTGVTEDEAGQTYGAVVAVATPILAAPGSNMRTATDRGSLAGEVVQLGGMEPRPKDLQLVEGIGPKIAAVLIEYGINDLGQLAATPVERLREILKGAGGRFRLADPDTWPRQAALGAAGDWAALTQLQTQLKAGK